MIETSKQVYKGRISFDYTNKKDILTRLNLMNKDGKIKNAGEVLFGKNPNIKLRVAIFATKEKTTFIDMQEFSGNIFNLIDKGEQYISKNIRWSANFNTGSFTRDDIPEVPIRAMREILCNSFLHRSWSEPYDNDLAIYSDRIEICNPGHFTDEATPEDYIFREEPSRPRNPLIAQIVFLSGEIEKWGTGIRNIYNKCKEEKIKVKFEDRKTAFFVVVYRKDLQGLIENTEKDLQKNKKSPEKFREEFREKFLEKFLEELSDNEQKILYKINENSSITQTELSNVLGITTRAIRKNIKNLKDKGFIERVGSDRKRYWKINL